MSFMARFLVNFKTISLPLFSTPATDSGYGGVLRVKKNLQLTRLP